MSKFTISSMHWTIHILLLNFEKISDLQCSLEEMFCSQGISAEMSQQTKTNFYITWTYCNQCCFCHLTPGALCYETKWVFRWQWINMTWIGVNDWVTDSVTVGTLMSQGTVTQLQSSVWYWHYLVMYYLESHEEWKLQLNKESRSHVV